MMMVKPKLANLRLRVLNLASGSSDRSPDILQETPFDASSKVRVCIRTVQQFNPFDVGQLAVQVCQVSADGRWVDTAKAVPFARFREMVVNRWVFGRIRRGGLACFFQPIVSPGQDRNVDLYGHEVLIRCHMSTGFTLTATDLFSLIWTRRQKQELHTAALWCCLRATYRCPDGKLFVNVDPGLVRLDSGFWDRVDNLLNENSFAHENLVWEILESPVESNFDAVVRFAREAKRRGYRIAIDDFGLQSRPFSMLLEIRPDMIKLEAEMLRNMERDPWNRVLAETIIDMARRLNIPLVVEGIEDSLQWQWALSQSVPLIQGYRFGRPSMNPVSAIFPANLAPETPFINTAGHLV